MSYLNLLLSQSRVETPFIGLKIGEYSFGIYNKETVGDAQVTPISKIMYPNYLHSLTVNKINGAVNTYTINLKYAIRAGDDPNFIDKVLSSISTDRIIYISYGDLSSPSFIYKEEKAMVTKVTQSIDLNSSIISYTLQATSASLNLRAGSYSFPKLRMKPSDKIKELLKNKNYGLQDIFYGMRDVDAVLAKGLIAGDDKVVDIEEKKSIDVFDYLSYLVSCMTSGGLNNKDDLIQQGRYIFTVFDDINNELGGPYFKVSKVASNIRDTNSLDIYEIDIGYPGNNLVTSFNIEDNEAYSILYNYSKQIKQPDIIYRINDDGITVSESSSSLAQSANLMRSTEANKIWWTTMTQYPIKATLTIKGLLKPALLMSYLRLNVLFYGQKHSSSGVYIITKQVDQIDTSGYRTTLSLTRIRGDE